MPCVGGKFQPSPNEVLTLRQQRYTVRPNPAAPRFPQAAEGRRATVYNLVGHGNRSFALKVFRKKYADASLADSAQVLARFQNLPGMLAAQRIILGPGDEAVANCPELMYASLMPWIGGVTWNDILFQAEKGLPAYDPALALRLCRHFLEVMTGLQREQAAHTDIAPGNVVAAVQRSGIHFVASGVPEIQLVDLEDIYASGVETPRIQNMGTPNYRHPSADDAVKKTTWCVEGDRYATAVMAAEMLLLGSTTPLRQSFEFGVFGGNRESSAAEKQVSVCLPYLRSISNSFAGCFEAAWTSSTLSVCPQASDLLAALPQPKFQAPPPGCPSNPTRPPQPPSGSGITWSVIPQPGFGKMTPKTPVPPSGATPPPHISPSPAPPPLSPHAAQFWSNGNVSQPPNSASPVKPTATVTYHSTPSSSGKGKGVIIFLVIITVLIAVIYGMDRMNKEQAQQVEMERERQAELQRQQKEAMTKAFTDYESWMGNKAKEYNGKISMLSVINACNANDAYVAVRFRTLEGDGDHWITMGWWKVEANTHLVLPVATTAALMYLYADAEGRNGSWNGESDSNYYQTTVVDDHSQEFLLKDGDNTGLAHHQVKMFEVKLPRWGIDSSRLTCAKK